MEKLIRQVTCGNVGLQNAVIIPKTLFPLMLRRLSEDVINSRAYKEAWRVKQEAKDHLHRFLTRRCSKEFLALYLESHPQLLDLVSRPGLLLSAVSEVDLAVRLHEFGLLPEEQRKQFVDTVSEYTFDGLDLYALEDPGIRSLFKSHEFEDFLELVRTDLLPRLDDVRSDWESSWSSDNSRDAYIQPLLDSFEAMKTLFADDSEAIAILERESRRAIDWTHDDYTPEVPYTRPSRRWESVGPFSETPGVRSIFDDVDA